MGDDYMSTQQSSMADSMMSSKFDSIGDGSTSSSGPKLFYCLAIGLIVFVLLVLTFGVIIYLGIGKGSGETTTQADGGPGDGASPGKPITSIPIVIPPSSSGPITAPGATPTTTAGPPPRAPAMPSGSMVCTVTEDGLGLSTGGPPDGICDVIFFDSFYKDGKNKVVEPIPSNVIKFRDMALDRHGYQKTQFGASFSVSGGLLEQDYLSPRFNTSVQLELSVNNIRHFAVINILPQDSTAHMITVALKVLRSLTWVNNNAQSSQRPSYFVLGAAIEDSSRYGLVKLMNDHFVPSLFIAVSHMPYPDARAKSDCRILPPTFLAFPHGTSRSDFKYGHTLGESCDVLGEVKKLGIQVPVALSFSLSGRLYQPRFPQPPARAIEDYEPFKPCKEYSSADFLAPATACVQGTEFYDRVRGTSDLDLAFTFDNNTERTFIFDTEKSMRFKVCQTKSSFPEIPFGVSAYDVHTDGEDVQCPRFGLKGGFKRVEFLRKMNAHLTSPSPRVPCLNITAQ